jgi:hypothetical protein
VCRCLSVYIDIISGDILICSYRYIDVYTSILSGEQEDTEMYPLHRLTTAGVQRILTYADALTYADVR